ncbi:MAG: ABC transporter ATP-binding protein [Pseudomonadota bacterium]
MIEAQNLLLHRGGRPVLRDLSFSLRAGERTAIVGPNGSGKSSLLMALSGLLKPTAGTIRLEGRDIARLARRQVAKTLAFLPQAATAPEAILLRDLVGHGRFAHRMIWSAQTPADGAAIENAMAQTGVTALTDRRFDTLSGGERQLGWLAMVLAQQPRVLLLDEPTTFLDLGHQGRVMSVLCDLPGDAVPCLVAVLHDLNHALSLADRVIVLSEGTIVADGPPADTLLPDLVARVFGARIAALSHERRTHIVPLWM